MDEGVEGGNTHTHGNIQSFEYLFGIQTTQCWLENVVRGER